MKTALLSVELSPLEVIDRFEMGHYYDTTNAMTPEQVHRQGEFTPVGNNVNLGHYYDTHWLRLVLTNPTHRPVTRVVSFSENIAMRFDFYELDVAGRLLSSSANGRRIPVELKEIRETYPAHTLTLEPLETRFLYMAFRSGHGVTGLFEIHTPEHYRAARMHQNYFYLFYFGVIVTIFLYNLIIYLINRDPIYLYYLAYVLLFNVWILQQSGYYALVTPLWMIYLPFYILPVTFFTLIVFTEKLLGAHKSVPAFKTATTVYKSLLVTGFVLMLFHLDLGVTVVASTILGFFYLGYLILRHCNTQMRLYAWGLSFYLLSVAFLPLIIFGVVEYNFYVRSLNMVGAMVETILFSVVLANRLNILRQELLDQQAMQNRTLQAKVEEQTRNLKILFQELHHRVKNNFQFILTFLWVKKKTLTDPKAIEAFDITATRIHAISLLHELLYSNQDTLVDFNEYIENFIQAFQEREGRIPIHYEIAALPLSFDHAVTMGLILNELLTNSYKHAFGQTPSPRIEIAFRRDTTNHFRLTYSDNGSGFDQALLVNADGLGYELIRELIYKLGGTIVHFDTKNGLELIISFPCEASHAP